MKKCMGLLLILIFSAQMLTGVADARINKKQCHRAYRIQQGMINGKLTPQEAKSLIRQNATLGKVEKLYRSDGYLSAWERQDLKADQNQWSRRIYRQKHDSQRTSS
jgi:hypothetical protein